MPSRMPRAPGLPFGGGLNVVAVAGAAYFAWEHGQGRDGRPHLPCPLCWLEKTDPAPARPAGLARPTRRATPDWPASQVRQRQPRPHAAHRYLRELRRQPNLAAGQRGPDGHRTPQHRQPATAARAWSPARRSQGPRRPRSVPWRRSRSPRGRPASGTAQAGWTPPGWARRQVCAQASTDPNDTGLAAAAPFVNRSAEVCPVLASETSGRNSHPPDQPNPRTSTMKTESLVAAQNGGSWAQTRILRDWLWFPSAHRGTASDFARAAGVVLARQPGPGPARCRS